MTAVINKNKALFLCQYLQHIDLEQRDEFSCEDDNTLILFENSNGLGSHIAKKQKKIPFVPAFAKNEIR